MLLNLEKLHFDPISNPSLHLVQTSQSKVFPPKKLIQVNFKSSQYCNFVLKIRNALSVNFSWNEKSNFDPILGLFCPKTPKQDFL